MVNNIYSNISKIEYRIRLQGYADIELTENIGKCVLATPDTSETIRIRKLAKETSKENPKETIYTLYSDHNHNVTHNVTLTATQMQLLKIK